MWLLCSIHPQTCWLFLLILFYSSGLYECGFCSSLMSWIKVNTYDGREELRSRAASGHEGRSCYILAEVETLQDEKQKHSIALVLG